MWTPRDLLRLAHADEARALAELAADQVPTCNDNHHVAGGELVEDAQRAVAQAHALLVAAVAAERGRSTSWERIGEILGTSRQGAQKRFGDRVEELTLAVLLPESRDHEYAELARDPQATVRLLDAWAAQQPLAAGPRAKDLGALVSAGLPSTERRSTQLIPAVTILSGLLIKAFGPSPEKQPPTGVTENYVREQQLRYQIAAFDELVNKRGPGWKDALEQSDAAFDELVALLADQIREQLHVDVDDDGHTLFTLAHGRQRNPRPVVVLEHAAVPLAPEIDGWWIWPADKHGKPSTHGAEQPLQIDPGAQREQAELEAIAIVANWIGSDLAKGTGPFDAGGIAGPPLP